MDWAKAVVHPLGLTGFALSLVFGVLARNKGLPKWWPAAAIALAFLCAGGGLYLAGEKQTAAAPNQPAHASEKQTPAPPAAPDQRANAAEGGTAVNVQGNNNAVVIGR